MLPHLVPVEVGTFGLPPVVLYKLGLVSHSLVASTPLGGVGNALALVFRPLKWALRFGSRAFLSCFLPFRLFCGSTVPCSVLPVRCFAL